MRQVFLDIETTGLSPEQGHRIVEIACVEWLDSAPSGRLFHHVLDPQRDVPDEATAIHGLSSEFLRGKPLFTDIAVELVDFVTGAEVVIHNAPFDLAFLDKELLWSGVQTPFDNLCVKVTDTLPAFRVRLPGQRCSLQALCERYNVALHPGDRRHSLRIFGRSTKGESVAVCFICISYESDGCIVSEATSTCVATRQQNRHQANVG